MDFVIPNGNEDAFVAMAQKLGTKQLIFLYSLQTFKPGNGIVCSAKQLKEAKKKSSLTVVKAEGDVRKIIEQKPFAMYGFEYLENKDSFHYRRSGLDQVSAKMMHENNVLYIFSFSDLVQAPSYMQPIILGRMYQNIMLAKKYKFKVQIASMTTDPLLLHSEKDMECLG